MEFCEENEIESSIYWNSFYCLLGPEVEAADAKCTITAALQVGEILFLGRSTGMVDAFCGELHLGCLDFHSSPVTSLRTMEDEFLKVLD